MVELDEGDFLDSLEDEEKKELFDKASEYMRTNRSLKLSTEQKLGLYGLFKQVRVSYSKEQTALSLLLLCQANVGPCNVSRPGLFDVQGRHKWYE